MWTRLVESMSLMDAVQRGALPVISSGQLANVRTDARVER